MKQARLMDRPEDFEALKINPDHIEKWEDSRRNKDSAAGNWEWWYFDTILDDGTKAVIQFFTKAGMKNIEKDGDVPSVTIKITTPEGKLYEEELLVKREECSFGTQQCDVHLGSSFCTGDFREYKIYVKGKKVGADLRLTSTTKPYRPGTAYFSFGDGEYFTWLCFVPQGNIEGTITYNKQTLQVKGRGYHDHQWGNRFYLPQWNNWVWARQNFDDYSALIFDFISSEKTGYRRFPIIFIQDKNGNIVFESRSGVNCTVPEMEDTDPVCGKQYPKTICYEFSAGGKKVTYKLDSSYALESQGFKNKPIVGKLIIKKLGMNLSYKRFLGRGSFTLNDGNETISRTGELIYEFMYPGDNCKERMEKTH